MFLFLPLMLPARSMKPPVELQCVHPPDKLPQAIRQQRARNGAGHFPVAHFPSQKQVVLPFQIFPLRIDANGAKFIQIR